MAAIRSMRYSKAWEKGPWPRSWQRPASFFIIQTEVVVGCERDMRAQRYVYTTKPKPIKINWWWGDIYTERGVYVFIYTQNKQKKH